MVFALLDRRHPVEPRHLVSSACRPPRSHTLIGSIVGVGVANAMMHGRNGTSGVDWTQAYQHWQGADRSRRMVGFFAAARCCCSSSSCSSAIPRSTSRRAPEAETRPPPMWIRGLLIFTCTGVSFFAWFQRRAEGHGPHHAYPHRHRADDLRAEPRACPTATSRPSSRPPSRGVQGRGGEGRRLRHDRRSAPRPS